MSAQSEFLRTHPAFAQVFHTGDSYLIHSWLRDHPQISQAWSGLSAPAQAAAPAAQAATSPAAAVPGLGDGGSSGVDWVDALYSLFKENHLEALASTLTGLVKTNGTGPALTLALQDSDAYKTRFSANEARKKTGIPVLAPDAYIATENQYRQIMAAAGLPKGFYDDPADFTKFLADDKSPAEIQARVQAHLDIAKKTDPAYRKMLQDTFGIGLTDGDIAAFSLDSARALPLLQREVDSVGIADAARRNGLGYSAGRADALAQAGVTGSQADQAYGAIAEQTAAESRAASAFGLDYSQTDAEDESLLGLASAKRKRQNVEGAFTAYNSGSSTSAKGANAKDTSGSY